MKKIVLIFFLTAIVHINTNAQEKNEPSKPHPIADNIAIQMCDYLIANKDSITTVTQFIKVISAGLSNYAESKMDQLLIEDGYIEPGNSESRSERARLIGRKIGQKVMAECNGIKEITDRLKQAESKKSSN